MPTYFVYCNFTPRGTATCSFLYSCFQVKRHELWNCRKSNAIYRSNTQFLRSLAKNKYERNLHTINKNLSFYKYTFKNYIDAELAREKKRAV